MANRLSTEQLSRLGSSRSMTFDGSKLNNTFSNDNGNQQSAQASSRVFSIQKGSPASVDSETFGVIKAFFRSRTDSDSAAETQALLLIDAARLQGTTALKLISNFNTDIKTINLDEDTLVLMNFLMQTSMASLRITTNNNKNCLRKRNIIA